jgi:hypothetical protein
MTATTAMATTTSPIHPKTIVRCTICRGERVMRDAWACWSYERQQWELGQTFDHAYCEDCERECTLEETMDDAS